MLNMGNLMKKAWFLAVVCPAVFLCTGLCSRPASAAYVTGGELALICQSGKTEDIFACMNYIAGVIDYQLTMQSLGTEPTIDFCLPEDLELPKAAATVVVYLKRSPEHHAFIAAPAVSMALHEAYPCAVAKTPGKKKK